jgi:hypothetical protein
MKKKMSDKTYIAKIEHLDATDPHAEGELCVRLPDELSEQLGWEIGDELSWEICEIGEDWGEHMGLTLSNLSKRKRDAEQAWRKAVSVDME